MNHTEELRELLTDRLGFYLHDNDIDFEVGYILSLLHKLNYQKVRGKPIMIAGELAGNKDHDIINKTVKQMIREGFKYCEPIEVDDGKED